MGVKIARMSTMPVGIELRPIVGLQIPTYPIEPPSEAEKLGKIVWDLPEMIKYVPNTNVKAYVEMSNPTPEIRLYAIMYYFLDPEGQLVEEDLLTFMADSTQFQAFYLPPQSPEPAFTTVEFSSSACDCVFGLRMLLLRLTDSIAEVIQETSRVQIMLASEETWREHYGSSFSDFLPMSPWEGPPLPRLLGIYWPWYVI